MQFWMLGYDVDRGCAHDYYRNFCAAIDGQCEQLVTHDQMRTVMKVIMAAFESAETGTVVKFDGK